MVASVTIVLTLALAVGAWFTRGLPRWARWLAVGDFVGTLAQAPLGRDHRLRAPAPGARHPAPPALGRGARRGGRRRGSRRSRSAAGHATPLDREPRLAGLGDRRSPASLLLASGTIATAAGPHSGGKNVYRLWRLHPALLLHGAAVAVLGCSLMFLIGYLLARRAAIGARYVEGAVGLAVLVLVQMALGDIQYRTHLPWGLVLVHVAVAATVWAATVAFVTLMWRPVAVRAAT